MKLKHEKVKIKHFDLSWIVAKANKLHTIALFAQNWNSSGNLDLHTFLVSFFVRGSFISLFCLFFLTILFFLPFDFLLGYTLFTFFKFFDFLKI